MTIGETVRAERKRLGLTQEALARRADLSLGGVHGIERGQRTDLPYSTLKKLSGALGLTIAQLVGEEQAALPKGEAPAEAGQRNGDAPRLLDDPRIVERLRARGASLVWGTMSDEAFAEHVRGLDLGDVDEDGRPVAVMKLGRDLTIEQDKANDLLWNPSRYRSLGSLLPVDPDATPTEQKQQRRERLGELRAALSRRYRRRAHALMEYSKLLSDPAAAWERAWADANEAA